jgi:hypothetical protein
MASAKSKFVFELGVSFPLKEKKTLQKIVEGSLSSFRNFYFRGAFACIILLPSYEVVEDTASVARKLPR